jgi:hypothetical protein
MLPNMVILIELSLTARLVFLMYYITSGIRALPVDHP